MAKLTSTQQALLDHANKERAKIKGRAGHLSIEMYREDVFAGISESEGDYLASESHKDNAAELAEQLRECQVELNDVNEKWLAKLAKAGVEIPASEQDAAYIVAQSKLQKVSAICTKLLGDFERANVQDKPVVSALLELKLSSDTALEIVKECTKKSNDKATTAKTSAVTQDTIYKNTQSELANVSAICHTLLMDFNSVGIKDAPVTKRLDEMCSINSLGNGLQSLVRQRVEEQNDKKATSK
jgi:hypothetical protein